MANLGQSVVMRRDLGMTPGLAAAQASHLHALWLHDLAYVSPVVKPRGVEGKPFEKIMRFAAHQYDWMKAPELYVLAVDTPEELEVLIKRAKDVGVVYHVWKDTIPSQVFSSPGKPYYIELVVGVSFGPDDTEKIKQVTGGLPLW